MSNSHYKCYICKGQNVDAAKQLPWHLGVFQVSDEVHLVFYMMLTMIQNVMSPYPQQDEY